MVVDIVLPTVFGLVLVREASVKAWACTVNISSYPMYFPGIAYRSREARQDGVADAGGVGEVAYRL